MEKRTLGLVLLATLATTASYAGSGFQQRVNVCLNVVGNVSQEIFKTKFVSSDFFDSYNHGGWVLNGQSCADHTYYYGPKNIRLDVEFWAGRNGMNDIKIMPDSTCPFMYNRLGGWVTSDYQITAAANEYWVFNITQAPPMNGYRYTFDMSCQHWSK